jgi:hypothetical protein
VNFPVSARDEASARSKAGSALDINFLMLDAAMKPSSFVG